MCGVMTSRAAPFTTTGFPKKHRQLTHKEVKLFAFFKDSIDEDGTVVRFGLCSFDGFAFVE